MAKLLKVAALIIIAALFPNPVVGATVPDNFEGGYAGSDFKTDKIKQLDLGAMKASELTKWFGKPASRSKRGRPVDLAVYGYAAAKNKMAQVRRLDIEFKDGVLVGYDYRSSFPNDHTLVTENLQEKLKVGMTMSEVKAAAPKPDGKARLPSAVYSFKPYRAGGDEAWVWNSLQALSMHEDNPFINTRVFVFFTNGVVSKIESNQSRH